MGGGGGMGGGECEEGAMRCHVGDPKLPAVPQLCHGAAWQSKDACRDYCYAGSCVNSASCSGSGTKCGPSSESCCQAMEVPGGTFKRTFDGHKFNNDSFEASVSSFAMDKFEVTVGRFRNFVAAYPLNLPHPGDGKTAYMPGDPGWDTAWPMPANAAELTDGLKCLNGTWADPPTTAVIEQRPINCVSFYVAYAFCVWDGGRLPTEAEWNYAAAGGNQQRTYPWSSSPSDITITEAQAVFFDEVNPKYLPNPVGSKSCTSNLLVCGDGRWGHADLAGNAAEWTLDYFSAPYPTTNCVDCWNTSPQPSRSVRGGSYGDVTIFLFSSVRSDQGPTDAAELNGFRCVHELKH